MLDNVQNLRETVNDLKQLIDSNERVYKSSSDRLIQYNNQMKYAYNESIHDLAGMCAQMGYRAYVDREVMRLASNSSDEATPECVICHDENLAVELPCHHSICVACFLKWYVTCADADVSFNCPTCRTDIIQVDVTLQID